ncbi:MAG: porin [Candidatus Accumulibacter sp.]|nr:porin [Accumulibacter sp.]
MGLNYASGPINLDAVYQSRLSFVVPNAAPLPYKLPGTSKSINEWYLGGSYDFKVVKFFGSYQALDNNNDVIASGINNSNLWTVGVNAPIGRGTLGLTYGRLTTDLRNLNDGVSWGAGTSYTYPLSKRTSVYGAYSYFSNNTCSSRPGDCCPGALGHRSTRRKQLRPGCRHYP